MEHRTVLVKKLKIGSLFDMYTPTVQDEPLTLNEEDALNNLRREFSSITSTALLNQLEKDCSLDTLSFSDEHNTLEEVIQIVPDRSPELMPLNTFTHLPQNDMKSMSRTSLLGLLDRVPSPSVDLSYNIHPGDSNETLTKPIDLLVTIGVYKPVPVSQMDLCTQAHYMTMAQRLVLLASQSLAVLKDAIRCPQDKVWLGDCSNALDDSTLHVAAEKLYTSSYFFIEGTFYDDLRNLQNKTLSSSLIGWAKTKQELDSLGPFTQTTMETTMLRDLSVYIGKPYFYVHQGNCEHAIVFLDVQLHGTHACQDPSMYPILTGRCYLRPVHCAICRRLNARWFSSNTGTLLPSDPCPLCGVCLRLLLYNEDGEKIDPKISVHMCCGEEVIVI